LWTTLKIGGRSPYKSYVCFAPNANYLEIVSDLGTRSFLLAFQSFIGRRGCPQTGNCNNAMKSVDGQRVLKRGRAGDCYRWNRDRAELTASRSSQPAPKQREALTPEHLLTDGSLIVPDLFTEKFIKIWKKSRGLPRGYYRVITKRGFLFYFFYSVCFFFWNFSHI